MTPSGQQRDYLGEIRRHLMTVAVPGAGKSKSVVDKVIKLLELGDSVIVVTFTKEAARELRTKIFAKIPNEWHSRCRVGTFHGLCLEDLKALSSNPVHSLRKTKRGQISNQRRLALDAFGFPSGPESMVIFDRAYSQMHDPYGMVEACKLSRDDPTREAAIALAERKTQMIQSYEAGLETNVLFDIARLLLTAHEHIQQGHPILRGDHLFVDEFQDVDEVQLEILLLLQHQSRIDVVGDDDQSIYRFRNGLGYTAFQEFQAKLSPSVIKFTTNYRSRASILNFADAVIARNKKRYVKKLHSHRGPGGEVRMIQFSDDAQEYEVVADLVQAALNGGAKSVAILSRFNKALERIQPALVARNLDFQCPEKEGLWENPPCSTLAGLLQYVADPSAISGLEHALDLFGTTGSEIVEMRNVANGRPIVEVFGKFRKAESVSDECRFGMDQLVFLMAYIKTLRHEGTSAFVDSVISAAAVVLWEAVERDPSLSQKQRERMIKLLDTAEKILLGLQGSFKQRLSAIERERQAAEECSLKLMTMHGSKGLEFEYVFIIQAADHLLPGRDTSPGNVEEERRLLYVAMTRARDALCISWAKRYGGTRRGQDACMTRLLEVYGAPRVKAWSSVASGTPAP